MSGGHGGKRAGAGRKQGQTGEINRMIKEAVIAAAEGVGSDGAGTDGMVGYLMQRAQDQPAAFMGLLGRAMPMQVVGDDNDSDGGFKAIEVKIVKP